MVDRRGRRKVSSDKRPEMIIDGAGLKMINHRVSIPGSDLVFRISNMTLLSLGLSAISCTTSPPTSISVSLNTLRWRFCASKETREKNTFVVIYQVFYAFAVLYHSSVW